MILTPTTYPMKPPPSARLITGHPLGDPAAIWTMSENCGQKVFDSSGNNRTGAFVGALSWKQSRYGSAIDFPGTNEYISGGSLSLPSPYTIVASAQIDIVGQNTIISLGTDVQSYPRYMIYDSKFVAWNSATTYRCGATVLVNGGHYHIAFVIPDENSGASFNLYLNGALDNGVSAGNAGTSVAGWRIGMCLTNIYDWNGLIDYLMIYPRVLNASEIQQLYYDDYCMFARRGWPVGFDTGIAPPVAAAVFGSLITDLAFIKYKKGIYTEV